MSQVDTIVPTSRGGIRDGLDDSLSPPAQKRLDHNQPGPGGALPLASCGHCSMRNPRGWQKRGSTGPQKHPTSLPRAVAPRS